MRQFILIPLILLFSSPVFAQAYYAEQQVQVQSQSQQVSGNYYASPYTPPQPQREYQPQPQPAPQPARANAQPWDYGQSVTTDIRQMNF